jgi:predicted nucleotidyltransferase
MSKNRHLQRDVIDRVVRQYGGSNIRIFGSAARGDATDASDLDILIKLESGRTLLDLVAMKQDLEDALGCKVDIVTDTGLSPYIRDYILEETVPL